jgi:hypothetical protein
MAAAFNRWTEHKIADKLAARGLSCLSEDDSTAARAVVVHKRRRRAARMLAAGAFGECTELAVEIMNVRIAIVLMIPHAVHGGCGCAGM